MVVTSSGLVAQKQSLGEPSIIGIQEESLRPTNSLFVVSGSSLLTGCPSSTLDPQPSLNKAASGDPFNNIRPCHPAAQNIQMAAHFIWSESQ